MRNSVTLAAGVAFGALMVLAGGQAMAQGRTWTGAYLGLNAGYASGSPSVQAPGTTTTWDTTGYVGGLHGGFNWQTDIWVIGLEGDADWGNLEGSRSFNFFGNAISLASETSFLGSIRGRLGYTIGEAMLYGTGGWAFSRTELRVTALGATSTQSENGNGWVAGGGFELKLARNWSGRIEGLYYNLTKDSVNITGIRTEFDNSQWVARAGLTFHLN